MGWNRVDGEGDKLDLTYKELQLSEKNKFSLRLYC